ncbi:hypothetical protein IC213_15965 [Clostridioides sp. ES-S-0049-02]|uniref:hypothetical protein n=1 Tax=Clostridioides sp. ES-S-0049-02 TaxID=2770778 RepID=UPI001D117E0D|nr:hypothetical protein [Clostridioides sp. ES-S-0049-02]
MKKGDFIWSGVLICLIAILVMPSSRAVFMEATGAHPYIGGFFKFAVLATMGDLLGARILHKNWKIPVGIFYRAVVWGIIGVVTTYAMSIYSAGVGQAQVDGMLPFEGIAFANALFKSATMNILMSPTVFLFHKVMDCFIDKKYEVGKGVKVVLKDVVNVVDWNAYLGFSVLKTIPFFWIPCHTIVFLFPAEYRVIASAFASIALGLILALANKSKATN